MLYRACRQIRFIKKLSNLAKLKFGLRQKSEKRKSQNPEGNSGFPSDIVSKSRIFPKIW